ncbi:MAG: S-layer homology domain-containing protein, partial [Eubacteriales bacterium]
MNKKFTKCMIVPAVCLSILASAPGNIFAAKFNDADIHWAKDAITIWADHEVIQGFDGLFRPDDTITRAEMAVMINRIMNYQVRAENTFIDLDDNWYTDAILKLVKQGVMLGHDNQIRPEDPVTREEALVMIARALGIEENQNKSASFIDSGNISEWAVGAIQAMTEKGFINGYEDGSFRPQDKMTRACSVTVVNNAVKGFYNKPGTYKVEEEINGIVIVNSPDVILEGMTINGDLIVTPGVKEGTVTLQGTTVSGQQIVMGGNVESKPGTSNPGGDSDNGSGDGSNGGSNGGSGGSSGGGGSTIQNAAATDIIVNSAYADETGRVTVSGKRYTIGENAFDTLEKAVAQAQTLNKKASVTLMSNLNIEQTVVLKADSLTLDGNGHTLSYRQGVKDGIQIENGQDVVLRNLSVVMNDEINKWNGSYGIQAYQSKVTLKNISVTGADGGILVNGAEVTLEGVVDVSGNEFGGI